MLVILLAFALQFLAYYLSIGRSAYFFDALSVCAVVLVTLSALSLRGLFYSRMIGVTFLIACWGGRLSSHLFDRAEKDTKNVAHEQSHINYVVARALWTLAVSACPIFLNLAYDYGIHPGLFRQPEDIFLVLLALMSIGLEWWADQSKKKWHDAVTRETQDFCRVGPWAWSRHPNYFAEVCFHLCIYGLSARHVPFVCVFGALMNVYVCIFTKGGVLGLERRRFNATPYNKVLMEYRRTVSAFFPIPPSLYRHVPFSIRRAFFMDWRMFSKVEEIKLEMLPISTSGV